MRLRRRNNTKTYLVERRENNGFVGNHRSGDGGCSIQTEQREELRAYQEQAEY